MKYFIFLKSQKKLILIVFSVIILFSCTEKENCCPEMIETYKYLVSDTKSFYFSSQDIQSTFSFINIGLNQIGLKDLASFYQASVLPKLKYGVYGYVISYKSTLPNSSALNVSGLVMVPDTILNSTKLASFQRFTVADPSTYPSNFKNLTVNSSDRDFLYYELIALSVASSGYVVSCPDFIGLGNSSNLLETYNTKQIGIVCADMLLAVKDFFTKQKINLSSDSVSIYGYSEGGYGSMALHQVLEERNQQPIRFSVCGSGIYHPSYQTDSIFRRGGKVNTSPGFLVKYANAISNYYIPNKIPLSDYVNEPYATNLANINPINWVNLDTTVLPDDFDVIFKSNFILDYKNQVNNGKVFYNGVVQNNIYNWKPKAPISLFQGTNDDLCFPQNADSAYNSMKNNGGNVLDLDPSSNIKYLVPGLNHTQGSFYFIIYALNRLLP